MYNALKNCSSMKQQLSLHEAAIFQLHVILKFSTGDSKRLVHHAPTNFCHRFKKIK
jgi:hypothetical protein